MTVNVEFNKYDGSNRVDLSKPAIRAELIREDKTSFIGTPYGEKGARQLYLLTYSGVVLAKDFLSTWDYVNDWIVDQWVDVDISIVE